MIDEIVEELPRKEDDYREIALIAQALTKTGENPGVEKMMKSVDDGHQELIQMLEDQRLFIEQVSKEMKIWSKICPETKTENFIFQIKKIETSILKNVVGIHVTDGLDRTSSVPITVLRLLLDKGQGLRSGLLVSINRVLQVQ